MRSTLARTFPTLYHSLTILRDGLNMFCATRMKNTSVPTEIAELSTSSTPIQTIAEMANASSSAMTKLNFACTVATPTAARMLWSVCSEKRSRSTCPRP